VKNSRSTLEKDGYMPSSDPIETVSSLCAQKKIEIDVADKWNKTPLHYASMIGSSISSIYLIQRGASISSVDIYGNTPLAVAMLYKQFHYAIILI
jgi:ankyrin repeat protein